MYDSQDIPKLSPFVSWPGVMINPQWLELPMSCLEQISMILKLFEPFKFDYIHNNKRTSKE